MSKKTNQERLSLLVKFVGVCRTMIYDLPTTRELLSNIDAALALREPTSDSATQKRIELFEMLLPVAVDKVPRCSGSMRNMAARNMGKVILSDKTVKVSDPRLQVVWSAPPTVASATDHIRKMIMEMAGNSSSSSIENVINLDSKRSSGRYTKGSKYGKRKSA